MNSSHWANLVSQGGVISTVWKSKINLWGLWLFLLLWARWFDDNIFQLKILHQSDTWWLNSLLFLFVFLSWKMACMENTFLRHLVSPPPPPLLCPLGCKQHLRASRIDPRVCVLSILSANISRVIWELIFLIVRDKPWLGWRRGWVGYTSAGCLGLSNNSQTCGNCLKVLVLFKETFQQHGTHISMASISWHIQGVPKKLPFWKLSRTNPNYMSGQLWTTLDGLEHLGQLSSREIPEGWLFLGHPIHMNTWPSEHPCLSVAMATIPWKFTKLKISKNQFLIGGRGGAMYSSILETITITIIAVINLT